MELATANETRCNYITSQIDWYKGMVMEHDDMMEYLESHKSFIKGIEQYYDEVVAHLEKLSIERWGEARWLMAKAIFE